MTKFAVTSTKTERTFGTDEIIVSKTDERGRITYANDVFCRVALYSEKEVLGQPHSIVRHPDMPRCVFKLLWDTIESGQEIFAYVKNMAKNGDFYCVFAHVTPSFGTDNAIIGYHSDRRFPRPEAIAKIEPLYKRLLQEEQRHTDRKIGMQSGHKLLVSLLTEKRVAYEEFIFSI